MLITTENEGLTNTFLVLRSVKNINIQSDYDLNCSQIIIREFKKLLRGRQRERHRTTGFNEKNNVGTASARVKNSLYQARKQHVWGF